MKLYENVVIGNFLYGLGFSIGRAIGSRTQLSVINLLQQTPDDQELGDMLVEFPGVVKLIEFKNRAGSLRKEKGRLSQLEGAIGGDPTFQRVSRNVHWYVETKPFETVCVNRIVPYLDAFSDLESQYVLGSFIDEIANEVIAQNPVVEKKKVKEYLEIVAKCQGTGEVGTGGVIISVSKDGITYVQYADIMQLQLQHKEFVHQVKNEYESMMKKSIEKNRSKNRGPKMERG